MFSSTPLPQLERASPELVNLLLGKKGNLEEERVRDEQDGQVWWDLGLIAYQLCTGGLFPFQNKNRRVMLRLISQYPVAFPQNLPYHITEDLRQLIRDLLTKAKDSRIGYMDYGGGRDVRKLPFFLD
jgi:serine/threonine protein kinase